MSKALRYLRIAFSATCIIACVLLIALWLRSYWSIDSFYRVSNESVKTSLAFNSGIMIFGHRDLRGTDPNDVGSDSTPHGWWHEKNDPARDPNYFAWVVEPRHVLIGLPISFAALLFAVVATVPWLPLRFSLRTLLIATTLIALVLGLVVWLTRAG